MVTVLPEGSQGIQPGDVETLRYAVRTDGTSGFLFLNNYQDHVECKPKKDEKITLNLPDRDIEISDISMASGEEAVLPFEMKVEGFHLIYAKAQPLSIMKERGCTIYFFFTPEGMEGEYVWDGADIEYVDDKWVNEEKVTIRPPVNKMSSYRIAGKKGEVEILTLTREQSLMFYEINVNGKKAAVLCDSPFIYDGSKIYVESPQQEGASAKLLMYPAFQFEEVCGSHIKEPIAEGIWTGVEIQWDVKKMEAQVLDIEQIGPSRYTVQIPEEYQDCKDALLQVDYRGDVGQAFINGELVSDNFSNHAVWEIGLKEVWKPEMGREITFVITPLKEKVKVDVSSTMAGRMEREGNSLAELRGVKIKPVNEAVFVVSEKPGH